MCSSAESATKKPSLGYLDAAGCLVETHNAGHVTRLGFDESRTTQRDQAGEDIIGAVFFLGAPEADLVVAIRFISMEEGTSSPAPTPQAAKER